MSEKLPTVNIFSCFEFRVVQPGDYVPGTGVVMQADKMVRDGSIMFVTPKQLEALKANIQ